ncbi:MAG: O-antigen ligase family protein [Anaerolineaceae bacterium]|nr:O-antigen ligase family protein [Anaerolineaceae bacterium]
MILDQKAGEPRWLSVLFLLLVIAAGIALGFLIPTADGVLKAVVITVGAIGAILTLFRVDIGLYALILMAYLRISDIAIDYHGLPSVFQPFIVLLIAAILIKWIRSREIQKGWGRAALLVLAYGMVVFTSLLYAVDYPTASLAVSDFAKNGVITVLLVILIQQRSTFRGALWVLVIAGIFTGSISVFQYLTKTFTNPYWGFGQAQILNIVTGTDDYRISGPIGDPNFYAQILVVIVPLAFHFLVTEKRLVLKAIAAWSLAVCSFSIIFTYSRGGAIALAVVLISMVLYRRPKPLEIILVVALVIGIFAFLPNQYSARLDTITQIVSGQTDVREEVSLRGRLSELLVAWQMFVEHPIIGVGVGNYPAFYQSYSRQIGLDPRTENREPHNLFLEVAAETGLVGFAVFMMVLYFSYQGIRRAWLVFKRKELKEVAGLVVAFGIGMAGYLTAALFIHGAYPRYFWLLVGLALALPQVAQDIPIELKQEKSAE